MQWLFADDTDVDIDSSLCASIKADVALQGHEAFSALSQQELNDYYITANRCILRSKMANFEGLQLPVPTPWDLDLLADYLADYKDQQLVSLIKFGWPVELKHMPGNIPVPANQSGAKANPVKVNDYVQKELAQMSIVGPFVSNPFCTNALISPIDAIPKKDSNDLRIILNLSHPDGGNSINNAVDKSEYLGSPTDLHYPSVDDLVALILEVGTGCALFKTDLKKYYRQIFYDPGCVHLVGFRVEDLFYWDISLSMGLRIACYIAQRISSALMYIYLKKGYSGLNYLDDLASAAACSRAWAAYESLYKMLEELCIWESTHKRCPPDVVMSFLGVTVDSFRLLLRLTPERLADIKREVAEWLDRSSASKKDMQGWAGKLNFASTTVRSGRLFFSRILTFMNSLPKHGVRKLPLEVKKDCHWWAVFLDQYDGVSMIHEISWRSMDGIISTDACLEGIGAFCQGEYLHAQIPANISSRRGISINELECLAVVVALKIWGQCCSSCNILLHCDNSSTVDVVNKGKAKNRFAQSCLHEIAFLAGKYSFLVRVKFKLGVSNRLADYLSRWSTSEEFKDKFFQEVLEEGYTDVKQVLVQKKHFQFSHTW